jgi:hypothetical protein
MEEAVELLQESLEEEERMLDMLKQFASDYEVEQAEDSDEEEDEEEEEEQAEPASGGGGRRR